MSSNEPDGSVPVPAAIRAALIALASAVDVLQRADWSCCGDDGVLAVVRAVEVQRRRLPSVDHCLVSELEVRSVAAKHLLRGTPHLLAELLHLDLNDARTRVRAAADLGARRTVTGGPQEPAHPATAAAQADGALSERHATVITRAMDTLPRSLDPEVVDAAELTLADHARHLSPLELSRVAERLAAHLDPDGTLTDDADRERRRDLTIGRQGADGMSPIRGLLTPACRALLDAAIAALARPSAEGDVPDPRRAGQRHHDALAALCTQLLATGTLPDNRGLPATVVITMTLDQLEAAMAARTTESETAPPCSVATSAAGGLGGLRGRPTNPDGATARTATGVELPLPDALRLAVRAHLVLAIFDRGGQPLYLSRVARLATPAQRLALYARDRGCTRPGCDAPAAWTEVHHLTEWRAGGATDITNLALVCPFDHHLITTTGYTVRLGDSGRIEWIPPAQLDPTRTPRINSLHHPPVLTQLEPLKPALTASRTAA